MHGPPVSGPAAPGVEHGYRRKHHGRVVTPCGPAVGGSDELAATGGAGLVEGARRCSWTVMAEMCSSRRSDGWSAVASRAQRPAWAEVSPSPARDRRTAVGLAGLMTTAVWVPAGRASTRRG